MNRPFFAFAITALMLILPLATPAHAQILDTYTNGSPIQLRWVVVNNNETATFRTDTSIGAGGDTVMTLWDVGNQTTVGGADGWNCPGAPTVYPSCFSFTNTTGRARFYYLITRSWRPSFSAITRIYKNNVPLADWQGNAGPVHVGGGLHTLTVQPSERQHITTAHMPGNADRHFMLVGPASGPEHIIDRFLDSSSGLVFGQARLDVAAGNWDMPSTVHIFYAGRDDANQGPVRLLKNDWYEGFFSFVTWQWVYTSDYDGDGLGHDLEIALGTCDRPSDMMAPFNGTPQPCSAFQFCDSLANADEIDICKAQLRDTDHDGLRDDVEVYGYDHSTTHMARYGADPTHADIFVELHSDNRDSDPMACVGFRELAQNDPSFDVTLIGNDTENRNMFEQIQLIYGAGTKPNPDGTTGINMHYDVGVPNPEPTTNTLWGDWGAGGSCIPTPDAPSAPNYGSACAVDTYQEFKRRWLFRWGVDQEAGGKAGACYRAGNTEAHVHELGHLLDIGHAGPNGTTAANVGAANGRPLYFSRMNYRYEAVGMDDDFAEWSNVTFSEGLANQANSRVVTEINPAGSGVNLSPINVTNPDGTITAVFEGGQWNVDWNQDGTRSGVSHMEVYRDRENGRNARGFKATGTDPDLTTHAYGTHHDAVVVNGVLSYLYVRYDGPAGAPARILKRRAMGSAHSIPMCPIQTATQLMVIACDWVPPNSCGQAMML